jgi:hypothetical protein
MRNPEQTETEAQPPPFPAAPSRPPRVRNRWFILLAVATITWLQLHFLSVRVIQTDGWPETATFLKADNGRNYGFVHGIHGAILIQSTSAPPEGGAPPGEDSMYSPEFRKELSDYMVEELAGLPRLAAYEGLFYFSWILLLRFGLRPAFRKLARPEASSKRKARAVAAVTCLALAYLLLPYMTFCYGSSAYSTWAGPYAMSSSGPYLPPTLWPGETISYRPVLEIVLLPMVALGRNAGWLSLLLLSAFYGWFVARVAMGLQSLFGKLWRQRPRDTFKRAPSESSAR